jgi:hypothetical protein
MKMLELADKHSKTGNTTILCMFKGLWESNVLCNIDKLEPEKKFIQSSQ